MASANDLFSQLFDGIAQASGSGANATGEFGQWLIDQGLNVAAISNLLNGVATSASATPQQIAYAQQEIALLQAQLAANQNKTASWVPLAGLGLLAYLVLKD